MNSIRSWEIRNGEDDESALIRRTAEIQKLQEEIIPNAYSSNRKKYKINLKGDELKDSYPRWRLKPTEQFDKNKEIDNLQDIDKIEKILDHRKIGRGYKYLIKWKGKPISDNSWLKGSLNDKSLRDDYLNKLKINKHDFTYCKINDNNQIINQNFNCINPKLNQMNVKTRNLTIRILSKIDFVMNDFGYQCYMKKNIRHLNQSLFFQTKESFKQEAIELSRNQCLDMIEFNKCDGKSMNCNDNSCSYNEIPQDDYGFELYPTTDGLFLVFEPPVSSKIAQILASFPLARDDNNIITPRDINDLMIAENDYLNYNVEEQIMHEHERNLLKFC
ncbi:hypothetical protein BpHYR1_051792, partial [Brachionus plicatilis]